MEDQERVITALRDVGVHVDSVWDLVNARSVPKAAIEVLIELLTEVQDAKVKEGVARALADRKARGIAPRPLIAAMHESRGARMLSWAIGNTLSVIVGPDDRVFDELESLITDRELGMGRQMLADALVKTRHARTAEVLLSVLDQEEMTGHVINALGRLRAFEAREAIEPYLDHSNKWFRKEAKKAIERIAEAHSGE